MPTLIVSVFVQNSDGEGTWVEMPAKNEAPSLGENPIPATTMKGPILEVKTMCFSFRYLNSAEASEKPEKNIPTFV